jgi:Holliday junction resolvase RusA-like endonuclease
VLDALKDVFDDTNVRRLIVEKSWGDEARTTVRVQ